MRALVGDVELLRDVGDGTVVLNDTGEEQPPTVESQWGVNVGHRGLLAVAELDSSTKPEASFVHNPRSVTNVTARYI